MDIRILELNADTGQRERDRLLDSIAALDLDVFGESRWGRESFSGSADNSYDYLAAAVTKGAEGAAGRLLGYGLLRCFDEAEIIMIASDPACRRQGIGRALLEALKTEAKRRNTGSIFLEVREGNEAARAMYRQGGFAEAGRRRGYYHAPAEDAVIMRYIC